MGQSGYYTAGSEVQLTCTVVTGGAPHLNTPNVCTWTKGGNVLPSTSQFRCVSNLCGLVKLVLEAFQVWEVCRLALES